MKRLPRVNKRGGKIKPDKKKTKYKVRNWHEYNESLVNRGSLEIWIEKGIAKSWTIYIEKDKRKKGAQPYYSDKAIETTLLIGKIYHQHLRQTEGLTKSIFKMAEINVRVPDYSTLSRKGGKIEVKIPRKRKGKIVAIVDSTGLKVYGEGEWKVRRYGYSKHRKWLKLHISIDKDGEIRAEQLTGNSGKDSDAGVKLLEDQGGVTEFTGDSGYDERKIYIECLKKGIVKIRVPPRKNARIWLHGNKKGERHPRDENLRRIRKVGKHKWKDEVNYHQREKAENTIYRVKTIFGDKIASRQTKRQENEVKLMIKGLNIMTNLGMPDSYPVKPNK